LGGAVRIVDASNTGAAFSMFRTGGVIFGVVAAAVSLGIIWYYPRVTEAHPTFRFALGLVLGGALGNLVDRVRLGHVVDFIDLGWWPVFNLADSAVVLGVALLVMISLTRVEREPA
jgi:signal peptidase II